jgi:ribosomal protein S4
MTDTPDGDRIAKVLSRAGIASRREAERMIALGQVSVNGRVITSPALNVTSGDRITVAGQSVLAADVARLEGQVWVDQPKVEARLTRAVELLRETEGCLMCDDLTLEKNIRAFLAELEDTDDR